LKRLEDWELVRHEAYQEKPVRYAYHLTEKGKSLEPMLLQSMAWGHARLGGGRYDPATGRQTKEASARGRGKA
jgi:DNA-binding HxlR family transcriptional regulator